MKANIWVEEVVIPTYEIGEAEKNPIFLEKRVYQGSSGKVYPYPTVESISNDKVDKAYTAVYLENEYLKVMVLPELGGRIQRAYDKTNNYDFVYYNQVVKPALVGLTGPWISGGIEFNWPQHHRPTTFLPVDYQLRQNEDGSVSCMINDVDQMYGTKGIAKFTLYPDKAYIEITGQLYNATPMAQTFLWWANPAVPVNDYTQSIFPPDVHAVMDHGKRDVSRFPIATGEYYKMDYSAGVDISRYKNIPVPTSYMAEKSKYDFVGGYDDNKEAGILHVADHHISPGKKQWTWGNGDFGQAWDDNLTDEDGPYVELMTGVYTDNQPDFTWLKPFEEKTFKQYFMPYKAVGQVKNATIDAVINMDKQATAIELILYTTSEKNVRIELSFENDEDGTKKVLFETETEVSPVNIFKTSVPYTGEEFGLSVEVYEADKLLVAYRPEKASIEPIPEPASAVLEPEEIPTNEELFFAGLHIEQYRHATYLPDPYYLEGLKRDPLDARINNAYGMLLMRRGDFLGAKKHFDKAIYRLTKRNPNPYDSEAYYNLGLVQRYLGQDEEAYDAFFKATWSNEQQEMAFYYLAALDAKKGSYSHALEMVDKALVKNSHNIKARGLRAYILRKLGKTKEALEVIHSNLQVDPFDFLSMFEKLQLTSQGEVQEGAIDPPEFVKLTRGFNGNHLMMARDYGEAGAYLEACQVLELCPEKTPMIDYYVGYYQMMSGDEKSASESLKAAEAASSAYCFPNKLEDILVLEWAVGTKEAPMACYYLGNLYYDKLQWRKSMVLWEETIAVIKDFPTVYRNLCLVYYNKAGEQQKAREAMEKAWILDRTDSRIFLELDQLYKKLAMSFEERLERFENNIEVVEKRDDLYIEYITLLNALGQHQKAYDLMLGRTFHPWEGGEGKVTAQYVTALSSLAREAMADHEHLSAEALLKTALIYPRNLGEGKLEGSKDNDLYYMLAQIVSIQGREQEAKALYEKATLGDFEPAGVMYYNDQPADMILYQGKSWQQLDEQMKANSRFYRLVDYGEAHLFDEVKIEYFAVSLPDFLIFEDDYTLKNKAHCYYLMALGHYGLGNSDKAIAYLDETIKLDPNHLKGRYYKKLWNV